MTVKVSWLFNGNDTDTGGKVWGFSESWYSDLTGAALISAMDNVSRYRALVLAHDTQIVGYRIGQTTGRSFVIRKLFEAPDANDTSNLPVDCALCQCAVTGSPTVKKFFIHDLPDDWIVDGHILASRELDIANVTLALAANSFMVRFQDPAAVKSNILSIDATGNVVTIQPITVNIGNAIQMLNVRDANNRAIKGSFIVETVTDTTHFKLAHWPGNVIGRRGSVRLVAFLFRTASFLEGRTIIGAASRKVGRPFFQQRGRAPIRR